MAVQQDARQSGQAVSGGEFDAQHGLFFIRWSPIGELVEMGRQFTRIVAGFALRSFGEPVGHARHKGIVQQCERLQGHQSVSAQGLAATECGIRQRLWTTRIRGMMVESQVAEGK